MAEVDVTAQFVRELLRYDPATGDFTWLADRPPRGKSGSRAGGLMANGYIAISIGGRRHYAHRLAWLHVHGAWPTHHIDHQNGVTTDNRIDNLRDVQRATNMQNMRRQPRDCMTGLIGSTFDKTKGLFASGIRVHGKWTNLGRFETAKAAHDAYIEAKRRLHPGCTI